MADDDTEVFFEDEEIRITGQSIKTKNEAFLSSALVSVDTSGERSLGCITTVIAVAVFGFIMDQSSKILNSIDGRVIQVPEGYFTPYLIGLAICGLLAIFGVWQMISPSVKSISGNFGSRSSLLYQSTEKNKIQAVSDALIRIIQINAERR